MSDLSLGSFDPTADLGGAPSIDPNQAPAYLFPSDGTGIPQAPWYGPILTAGANIGIGFANSALYGTPGLNYTGPTPWITQPGTPQAGTQVRVAANNNGLIFLAIAAAAIFLIARK